MDNAQIEHELEDMEARLERLRSLYEQYFMGLEKTEPAVLRKDVDRKLWALRREQIRNTALRFKFQMLIQRYNTYQQHWTRVVREIESGTYRRDVIKVAQRFGEKDALTIVGRRRAEQYKRLAANQIARRDRRRGAAQEEAPAEAAPVSEEEISLSVSDYELIEEHDEIEDEESAAPTPPRGVPAVKPRAEPDMEALLQFATVGVLEWRAPPAQPAPAPPAPIAAREEAPAWEETTPVDPPRFPEPAGAPERPLEPPRVAAAAPTAAQTRAAAQAASKSRVAELAAQMRAKKQQVQKPTEGGLDLDLFETAPAAPKPAVVVPSVTAPKPAPATSSPLPRPAVVVPSVTVPKPTPATSSPLPRPAVVVPSVTVPKPAPATSSPLPRPAAAPKEDLSEQKMREIYAKYVGAKRAANESTAGITYDKLAASLRAQADKLRSTHPSRSIDFEIVTKDGKTALRPVLK